MKTEPSAFSWQQLVKEKSTIWDGVRNYQARNNMKSMKVGDLALIYHSVSDKEVVGIAKISKEYFQDPSSLDANWVAVELVPDKALKNRVNLATIKSTPELSEIALIKQSRLSVVPLTKDEFDLIIAIGQK